MRITCPNCAAQYEVETGEIPPAGRDLICSACGHAWFHGPEGMVCEPAAHPDLRRAEADPPAEEWEAEDGAPVAANPAPPPLDPALRAVLRDEAEREARARHAEASARAHPPGTPPQTPAGAPDAPAAPTAGPDGPPRDEAAPQSAPAGAPAQARTEAPAGAPEPQAPGDRPRVRAALPAVKDIPPSAPGAAPPRRAAPRPDRPVRRRSRAGLVLLALLGVAVGAAGLYVHTRSAEAPPAAMLAYADWVDQRHAELAAALRAARGRLDAGLRDGD